VHHKNYDFYGTSALAQRGIVESARKNSLDPILDPNSPKLAETQRH